MTHQSVWQIISAVLYAMNMGLAVYIATAMILKKRDPVKTLSWAVVLILLPYIGVVLFLFFGQNFRKRKIFGRKGEADYKLRRSVCNSQIELYTNSPQLLSQELRPFKKIIFQNLKTSNTLLEKNSNLAFFFTGRDALDAMYECISKAKSYIHLQSYIIENDNISRKFKDLLIKKAKERVEVRILYDGIGGYHLKKKELKTLIDNGIEVLNFSPVRFLLPTFKLNYRNHRKILIVDGKYGFLGGVNIADRYYYGTEEGDWHDTHIKVEGESIFSLQTSFLLDRYFVINRKLKKKKYYNPNAGQPIFLNSEKSFYSQTITSGPDSNWANIMQCYLGAISAANNHIYIVTPYFMPNESILNAIKIAALGNIDVRIMLPDKSDTKITHWGTMSYVQELLEAGVKVYFFKNGFNHSKVISIDGKMCIVGSANMDNRSLEHNFEIMSIIYSSNYAEIVENRFILDIDNCKQTNISKWEKRDKAEKIKESFARLWSPLL